MQEDDDLAPLPLLSTLLLVVHAALVVIAALLPFTSNDANVLLATLAVKLTSTTQWHVLGGCVLTQFETPGGRAPGGHLGETAPGGRAPGGRAPGGGHLGEGAPGGRGPAVACDGDEVSPMVQALAHVTGASIPTTQKGWVVLQNYVPAMVCVLKLFLMERRRPPPSLAPPHLSSSL